MPDPWSDLLAAVDSDGGLLCGDRLAEWPPGAAQEFERRRILRSLPPFDSAVCRECPERPLSPVAWIDHPRTGRSRPWLQCPVCGASEIAEERLHRREVDTREFVAALKDGLGLAGRTEERAPARLWRLGALRDSDRSAAVWLIRGMPAAEIERFLPEFSLARGGIVLTPRGDVSEAGAAPCASLATIARWNGRALAFETDALREMMTPGRIVADSPRRPMKRGNRTALIERLRQEMESHLRAARAHALAAIDHDRVPTLLPKPTRRELAQRCGATEPTVSRCFADASARELRWMWELADDLDRLLQGNHG